MSAALVPNVTDNESDTVFTIPGLSKTLTEVVAGNGIGDKFLEADGTLAATTAFDALHLTHKGYHIWSVAMAAPLHQLLTAKKSEQHGI